MSSNQTNPSKPVRANAREQVGNLGRLPRGNRRSCLGDQYRILGQLTYDANGWSEQGREPYRSLVIVAIDPHPGHVRTTRPPGVWFGNPLPPRSDGIDRPQPRHVLDSLSAKHGHDVPPSCDEDSGGRVPIAPGVPPAIHLVAEAQDHWVLVRANSLCVGGQITVVSPGCNRSEADACRVDLHERHRSTLGRCPRETDPEMLKPTAVVSDDARLDLRPLVNDVTPEYEAGTPCTYKPK